MTLFIISTLRAAMPQLVFARDFLGKEGTTKSVARSHFLEKTELPFAYPGYRYPALVATTTRLRSARNSAAECEANACDVPPPPRPGVNKV